MIPPELLADLYDSASADLGKCIPDATVHRKDVLRRRGRRFIEQEADQTSELLSLVPARLSPGCGRRSGNHPGILPVGDRPPGSRARPEGDASADENRGTAENARIAVNESPFLSHRVTDVSVDGGVLLEDRLHGLVGEHGFHLGVGGGAGPGASAASRTSGSRSRSAMVLMKAGA